MTGKAVDYSITPVSFYKFVCNDPEIKSTYVGHTTNFIERKSHHKSCCIYDNNKLLKNIKLYKIIRNFGGWENWRMVEIESRIVKSKRDAEKIEQDFMDALNADMNTIKSFAAETTKEYLQNYNKIHFDHLKEIKQKYNEKHKEYFKSHKHDKYLENKDKISIRDKKYRDDNREILIEKRKKKVVCECGCILSACSLSDHKKSQRHTDLMETKAENITLTIKEEVEEKVEKVEKRELKWLKNNENVSIDYYYFRWNLKMTYLCVDIRNYHGRHQ